MAGMGGRPGSRPNHNRAANWEIMENSDVVFHNITSGLTAMDNLLEKIDPRDRKEIDFKPIPFWARAFERYRWPATMALQSK